MADVLSILPPNATAREHSLEQAGTGRIEQTPVDIHTLWNADTCPLALLPWLAWALDVEFFSSQWLAAEQRNVIRQSYQSHNIAGTLLALKNAIMALGYSAVAVREYNAFRRNRGYTYNGKASHTGDTLAYTYDLEVTDLRPTFSAYDGTVKRDGTRWHDGYSAPFRLALQTIMQVIAEHANVRSHLRTLSYVYTRSQTMNGRYNMDGSTNFDNNYGTTAAQYFDGAARFDGIFTGDLWLI
jgi:phage tail P2-like protein